MYNIGIIGCGKRVGNDLLPILLQNNGDFRIKAVCDPNVKGMKEKFKGRKTLEELFLEITE